jgi:hypothetical protein
MHISFESETAFDLWNKTRRIKKDDTLKMISIHYNKELNPQKPWVVVCKKEEENAF